VNESDPRVKRTRKLLQDALMELLGERSFQSISVQDIAERATLNRATFYTHFEDKYALVDYMIRDMFREALAERLPPGAPFTVGNLRLLVVTVLEFLSGLTGHCAPTHHDMQPVLEAKVQDELNAYLLAWLEQAQPAVGARGVRRETVASVMSWAIFGAGIEWSRGERTRSSDEWAHQILEVIVGGLSRVVDIPATSPEARSESAASIRLSDGGRRTFAP
jgi:AcrR family transcriptional regulator